MSWNIEKLGNLLAPSGFDRGGANDYPVLSITMHEGLVDQSTKFKKRIASNDTSNYRVAYSNELVVGFPIDEGVLGFQTQYPAALVSPAYNIWKLKRPSECYIPFIQGYLRSNEARSIYSAKMRGAVARRRNITREDFLGIDIPFPPLDDQKRISIILEKADILRQHRQVSLQLNEKLLRSVFIDMFVRNPDAAKWTPRTVEWMAKDYKGSIRTGPFGSQLLHSEFVDAGIAVLGIDNAVKNRFEWGRPRFITLQKYQGLKRYKVFPGDLIITIMGTLGRCAVVPDDIPEAINTKHLCCITLNREKCLPEFLHAAFLHHPDVLRQLGVRTIGAVMPGLNMGIIRSMKLPLPPIELQTEFKHIVDLYGISRNNLEDSQEILEKLFSSIQQRVFRDEIDLSRLILEDESLLGIPATPLSATNGRYKRPGIFVATPDIEEQVIALEAKLSSGVGNSIAWDENYFKYRILSQVLDPPFSFTDLWAEVEHDIEEPNYEIVKDAIYRYIEDKTLVQKFHETRKEIVFEPLQ